MSRHTTFIFSATVILLSACSKEPTIEQVQGYAQGTDYTISWWSENDTDTKAIKQEFSETLEQVDKEISTYRPDSYISGFNNNPSIDWQPASKDFIELLEIAQTVNADSLGCYDPTIGPLFDLWGFQSDKFKVPSPQDIADVQAEVGLDKIEIDLKGLKIRKILPQLALNFSSMGEGYTIYKLSHVLEKQGITNYLISFGGDMKIRGHKPADKQWRIAIQNPKTEQPTVYKIITINDQQSEGVTLDTSGTYRHYFDENGQRYSHILDARTGAPVTHNLISASVFGNDPRVSDAWATAMLCLGEREGSSIAEQQGLSAFFIQDKESELIDSKSSLLTSNPKLVFNN